MEANALGGSMTINLPAGTYTLTIAGNGEDSAATGDLDVTTYLNIIGAGADVTTVAQSTNDRVFDILAGNEVSIAGVTIADGALPAGQGGAGIRNQGDLFLIQITLKDNSAISGGGAMFQFGGATAVIVGSTISDNAAGTTGGGIENSSSALTIIDSTMSGNTADLNGGAVNVAGVTSDVLLVNVTITGNTADADDNTFGSGGGVSFGTGKSLVANSIIAGNSTLSNSADDCSGTVTSGGHNLIGHDAGCTFVATTGDQVGTLGTPIDPLLGSLQDNGGPTYTHLIHGASPAVDAANPAAPGSGGLACQALDQRGEARAKDGNLDGTAFCDVGALEADEAPACSGVQCLNLDMDADLLVTVGDLFLNNAPCNASGDLHLTLDAVGDSNGAPNGKEDQAFTIDFLSGWVTCPGPLSLGSSIVSGGYFEEQSDTTAGLDFPVDVDLLLCLKIDTLAIVGFGVLQNCQTGFTKSPIMIECVATSYDDLVDCEIITTGGTPKFLDTSGVEKASIDSSVDIDITSIPPLPKLTDPGDTDKDGCSDERENGPDETLGGLRDYTNPNDYYDVYGPGQSLTLDGVIDLPNDILGVIQHFAPAGLPPYDVRFDRGVTIGANHWERAAPDGVIDLPNDILGVILQFQHNCV